jgi:hypothetical protein
MLHEARQRAEKAETEVERLKAALALYGPPNCDFLHHKSSDRHEGGVECPVVKRIKALKGE